MTTEHSSYSLVGTALQEPLPIIHNDVDGVDPDVSNRRLSYPWVVEAAWIPKEGAFRKTPVTTKAKKQSQAADLVHVFMGRHGLLLSLSHIVSVVADQHGAGDSCISGEVIDKISILVFHPHLQVQPTAPFWTVLLLTVRRWTFPSEIP